MATQLALPPGRWLLARSRIAGVYCARYEPHERWIVAYFDPSNDDIAASVSVPIDVPWSVADPDWFYADGERPGFPTRADRTC